MKYAAGTILLLWCLWLSGGCIVDQAMEEYGVAPLPKLPKRIGAGDRAVLLVQNDLGRLQRVVKVQHDGTVLRQTATERQAQATRMPDQEKETFWKQAVLVLEEVKSDDFDHDFGDEFFTIGLKVGKEERTYRIGKFGHGSQAPEILATLFKQMLAFGEAGP